MKKMPSSSSSSGTATANSANSGAAGTNSNREANSNSSNPSNSSNGKNDNTNTNSGASKHTNSDNHVRIVQNSESDLQALFDSVLKPDSKRPLQVPWHMRNLPDSFFTPPSTGSKSPSVLSISHSRENSADAAFGTNTTPAGLQVILLLIKNVRGTMVLNTQVLVWVCMRVCMCVRKEKTNAKTHCTRTCYLNITGNYWASFDTFRLIDILVSQIVERAIR